MTVTVIATVAINEAEPHAFAQYMEIALPLIEGSGGRLVDIFTVNEVLVGNQRPHSVILMEYPSREVVEKMLASDAYKKAIPYRDIAFSEYYVAISSEDQVRALA